MSTKTSKKTLLISMSLPVLQNALKRDPESYQEEFIKIYLDYLATMEVFKRQPSSHNEALLSHVYFISQVAHCYKATTFEEGIPHVDKFSAQLMSILKENGTCFDSDMRMGFCKALIALRGHAMVGAVEIYDLFFHLFLCPDKILRKMLCNYIIQDIKNVNMKRKNMQLNKTLQNYMYKWIEDDNKMVAKMALDVMVELYRRKVWNDTRTVNVISKALTSKQNKILVAGLKFFLGMDQVDENENDSDDDDQAPKKSLKELMVGHRVGKKSKKRQKRLERAKSTLEKHKKKHKPEAFEFSAIHLLNDPQDVADKLFNRLANTNRNERFEVRLMMMNLVSRLIGIHQLILLNFYAHLELFLKPSQSEVTKLLMFVAQASHDLVPPEVIESVIRKIANNFITERNASEVIAVGLNAVREICLRCPLSMTKELLDDFVEHKKHKDKGVLMAARSLIGLFRLKNPGLLHRNNRGKPTESSKEIKVVEYGELNAKEYIAGAEILLQQENNETRKDEAEWESCSEEENEEKDDSDGSWIDVSHSSDEEEKEEPVKNAVENVEQAKAVTEQRIFTDEDFKKIKIRQVTKEIDGKKSKKRTFSQMNSEEKEIIPIENIESVFKKRRHDREARLETVMAGREGRMKYGQRKKRKNTSTTNRKKQKSKSFMMVKHKINQKKGKRSFQEKKQALQQSLQKRLKSKF